MKIDRYVANIPDSFKQFSASILKDSPVPLHSMYVVGSVLSPDYLPSVSDVNSLILVEENELSFLDFLVELGRKYHDRDVAPPLVMTPAYIQRSLDVFPMEFFNFREIHHTLHGQDILQDLQIESGNLRLQCERESKAKLLWLGQVYIESLGDRDRLAGELVASIRGYLPLFRAILHLAGEDLPEDAISVFNRIGTLTRSDTTVFTTLFQMKNSQVEELEKKGLCQCHGDLYRATEGIAHYVDTLVSAV